MCAHIHALPRRKRNKDARERERERVSGKQMVT